MTKHLYFVEHLFNFYLPMFITQGLFAGWYLMQCPDRHPHDEALSLVLSLINLRSLPSVHSLLLLSRG